MRHTFTLEPRDLLFLRDARPMAASDAGLGANWPRPDQLWNAVINAFHRQWPEPQCWEGTGKHTFRDKRDAAYAGKSKDKNAHSSFRFGALKTVGPFPYNIGTRMLYLPCPLDVGMEMVACEGTDLPCPLNHAFRSKKLGKTDLPPWISADDYVRYLAGENGMPGKPELFDIERNIGIAIDAETQTAAQGQLYQAEYLRLRPSVALAFEALCDIKPKGIDNKVDVFARADCPDTLVVGGQQGVARLRTQDAGLRLPQAEITTRCLRWTLAAPALFNAGWLPGWCCDSRKLPDAQKAPLGSVMLPGADARLIAARIGKPVAFSGWDLQTGPKPTQLAVPAGSCYVFDCGTIENAQALARLLHGCPRSDRFGEKGFGIGLCSSVAVGTQDARPKTQTNASSPGA